MIIDATGKNNVTKFGDLSQGDAFLFRGWYCLKTEDALVDIDTVSAVDLSNGEYIVIKPDECVTPLPNAKIVI